jgi:uncharacterized protein
MRLLRHVTARTGARIRLPILLALAAGALCAAIVPAASAAPAAPAAPDHGQAYVDSIRAWQTDRQERLKSPTGWLTVAGLFWLEAGENSFGTDPGNKIVLPEGSAPAHAGSFVLAPGETGGVVTLHADPASGAKIKDVPVLEKVLAADDTGEPDVVSLGRLTLFVIHRGERVGIRMKDPESPIRKAFQGLEYFPIDPAWRVSAEFVPAKPPFKVPVPNILGYSDSMSVPGRLVFKVKGKKCELLPLQEDPADSSLFIIFRDETSGAATYGGGRFLYAAPPRHGRVTLDFNLAYNPPCALNPYTTCPMPPKGNELKTAVEAGEKAPPGH